MRGYSLTPKTAMIRIDSEVLKLVREQAKKHDRSIRSMLAILVKAALSQGGQS